MRKGVKSQGAFFDELEWMPEGKKLWKHIKKYNPIILHRPKRKMRQKHIKK